MGGLRDRFVATFDVLEKELLEDAAARGMTPLIVDRVRENMRWNVLGGKMNRGLAVVSTLAACVGTRELSEREFFLACVVGWCIEWLQAAFLVADDVMDDSVTRRGQPCWFRKVGHVALNDAFLLEGQVYVLLARHVRGEPCYGELLGLFHQVTYRTELGQLCDLTLAPEPGMRGGEEGDSRTDYSTFTESAYRMITCSKTSYYSFYLPVAAGMRLAGIRDESAYSLAESILVPMGVYFQAQDDYLDCYADPEVLGKKGTDIKDNKCSWLAVQFLAVCDAEERRQFEEHYARPDDASEAKIRALYDARGLPQKYLEFEEAQVAELRARIASQNVLPAEAFTGLLDKIYKRNK